jgi:threonine dehydrogenase-like Zn-dependent dehydrogenase
MTNIADPALLTASMLATAVASNRMAKAAPDAGADKRVLLVGLGWVGLGLAAAQAGPKDRPVVGDMGAAAAQAGAGLLHAFAAHTIMKRSQTR